MLTTAKIEKVYSPAELCANPIGTKPAVVTSVPVSMAKASVLKAKVAASSLSSPGRGASHGIDGGHRVVDEQAQRDDQGAERDALQVDPERSA